MPNPGNTLGPAITAFAVAQADDFLIPASGETTVSGVRVPVYVRSSGSQFRIVIEGKPGLSGQSLGTSTYDSTLRGFPDLQVVVSRQLGNGSAAVCDINPVPADPGAPPAGGVPATDPPNFDLTPRNIAVVNDLACRFRDGAFLPMGVPPGDSCVKTRVTEDYEPISPDSTLQFCSILSTAHAFPAGDTLVTARLRDVAGNVGPQSQIVIRVSPPTP